MESSWTEMQLEKWMRKEADRQELAGEPLLILRSQRRLTHTPDLVAIDSVARPTLIELKNERSTRQVLGQVLEYLWDYRDATLDDLVSDFEDGHESAELSLAQAFQARFGTPLPTTAGRYRLVIVAPSFDSHTSLGIRFLSERLDVSIKLITAAYLGDDRFILTEYRLPTLEPASSMGVGQFGLKGNRLNCVLEAGNQPVLWTVGRQSVGGLTPLGRNAFTTGMLKIKNRVLTPIPSPAAVNLSESGTFWNHREKEGGAWLIGRVQFGEGSTSAVYGRWKQGKWAGVPTTFRISVPQVVSAK